MTPWAVLQNVIVLGLAAYLCLQGHPWFGGLVAFLGVLVPRSKKAS